MKKVGEVLKEQRQKKNLTVETLADRTKIQPKFIIALENNSFELLPSAPFVKGFIRSYATVLGLDPTTILALLRRDFKTTDRGEIIPRTYLKPLSRKQNWITPRVTAIVATSIVSLVILSYGAFQWWKLSQPPPLAIISPIEGSTVEKNIVVKGRTMVDAIVFVDAKPVALTQTGEFETTVFANDNGNKTITIKAQDRAGRETVEQRTVNVEE